MNVVRRWLTPPVFPDDEIKTRQVALLDFILLFGSVLTVLFTVTNSINSVSTPGPNVINLLALITAVVLRQRVRHGHIKWVSEVVVGLCLVGLTVGILLGGNIREPAVAGYFLLIIVAGLLLNVRGLIAVTVSSSLATGGIIWAEQAGLIYPPAGSIGVGYWLSLTVWLICIGLLAYAGLRSVRTSLRRVDRELAARRTTESALRRSEHLLADAQALMHLGSYDLDLVDNQTYWTEETYRILGRDPAQPAPTATDFARYVHPVDVETVSAAFDRAILHGETLDLKYRIVRPSGEVRFVHSLSRPVVNAEGRVTHLVGTLMDITERKQMEDALQFSDQRYRSLFEDSPISLWEEDFSQVKVYLDSLRAEGVTNLRDYFRQKPEVVSHCANLVRVLDVNKATVTLLRAPDKASVMTSLSGTLSAEAHVPFSDELSAFAEGALHCVMDEEIHTFTGQKRLITVNVSLAPGYTDTWGKVLVSILDITARKQGEEALQRQNQYLAALQETMLDLTAQHDLDQLLENIVARAAALMDASGGFFDIVDLATNQLQPRVGVGVLSESLQHSVKPGEGVAGTVWQTQQALVINNYDQWLEHVEGFSHGELGSLISVPLLTNGQVLGVLGLAYDIVSGRTFEPEAIDIMTQFARLAAIAIENARLFQAAQQELVERRQVEQALRQSEALFHSLVETLPLNIFRKDADGRFIFINSLYCQTQGWTREEILGKTDFDLHPRDLAEKYSSDDKRLVASGAVLDTIEEHQPLGGPRSYVQVVKSAVYDRDGRMIGLQGAFWDVTERQHLEIALRDSRDHLQAVLDSANDALFVHDADTGQVIDVNQRMCEMFGYTRDEALQTPIGDLSQGEPPYSQTNALLHLQQARTSGPQVFEWLAKRKNGQLFWAEVSARFATFGQDARFVVAVRDISERKQTEQAEREQRALAEALRDTAAALNSTLDLDEVLDRILANAERVVPHEAANIMLIDQGVARIVRARGFAEHGIEHWLGEVSFQVSAVSNMRYMLETGCPLAISDVQSYPGWVNTPEIHWARSHVAAPLRLKGRVVGFLNLDTAMPSFYTPLHAERLQALADQAATAIDNAQLLKAERTQRVLAEALRDTAAALNGTLDLEEVFERILVNVGRVVAHDTANLMLIDDQGVARIVRHTGYDERGLVNFANRMRLPVRNVPNLQHMVDTGEPRVMPNVRQDPEWIDWPESRYIQSIASAPIRIKDVTIGFLNLNSATSGFYSAEHGERLRAFASQAAVAVENARLYEQVQHHSQQLEQRVRERTAELLAANERLMELDRLKDEFLSRISHELRTPLTSMKIYLELLENGKPSKRDEYLQTLKHETDRLHQLIEDVLEFSQLNLTTESTRRELIDLNHLLEGRLTTWERLSTEQELAFQLDLQPSLPLIQTDSQLVIQALTRLISNAVNYTTAGSVTVSTAYRNQDDRRWVTISVRDTGPGIAAAELPHIFERFYRGRAAANYKIPGTGIGLTIAQEIVTRLKGHLTVESQLGIGSTFTLWLPADTTGR